MAKFVSAWINEEKGDLVLVDADGGQVLFPLDDENTGQWSFTHGDSSNGYIVGTDEKDKVDLTSYTDVTARFIGVQE